jgi:hypothetical protein
MNLPIHPQAPFQWIPAGAQVLAACLTVLTGCQAGAAVAGKPANTGMLVPPQGVAADSTFCNPLNLEYCFTPYGWNGREAADPLVVPFKGAYYLFPSKSGGYWWSKNLIHWTLVPSDDNYRYIGDGEHVPEGPEKNLPVWGYGPLAAVMNGELVYSQQTDAFVKLLDPKLGTFEKIRDRLPVSNDDWLFVDDDGKVYLYAIGFNPRGIYVCELDPKDHLKVLRGPEKCMPAGDVQPDDQGRFRIGPVADPTMQIGRLTGEGCQMTRRNGRYFLQVSFSGTEMPIYRDCAFVADSPWGPFRYANVNPVAYRPAGFAHGAGNTGVFAGPQGKDWRVVTTCVGVKHGFERRVSMYPAGVDKNDAMYTDTYLGDLPQFGPGRRNHGLGANLVGWMLLSHKKRASASSVLDGHPVEHSCDENIQTWWSAKTGEKDEWLALDLGKKCRIHAVQVNFAEQDTTAMKRRAEDELYHQYTLEVSEDGRIWEMAVDKSGNRRDVPHDYVQFEKPVMARHIKLSNIHMPGHGKFALRDLRVFGSGLGRPPSAVSGVTVRRQAKDITAQIEWPAPAGADGYVVRWGSAPDKLYLSQDVRDGTKAVIDCLTGGQAYWFSVDSFNDSGITFGAQKVPAGGDP